MDRVFPDLPVSEVLPALRAALAEGANALLVAPPGAGKTTTVPLALLDAAWLAGQRIVMLEPRRLAARAAATRMASLLGEPVGQTVGYRTRLDSAVSPATRIEVVTEGLLVRRMLADPGLHGAGLVILDEIHERALDADLALAFCRNLQTSLRPELRLLAMSATPDAAAIAGLLDARLIESPGRAHPVDIRHAPRDLGHLRDLPEAVARAIRTALAEHAGDLLAFLPGMSEIRRAQSALAGCDAQVLPLHGNLPAAEQDRALRPAETRRVILATSIAETSLTVPGVRIVVDGGWRRAPVLDDATGLTRLATQRISRAAATQRAGRAGREAPGIAFRLWTTALHRGLPEFDRPEILRAELSQLALDCAAWGESAADLAFPDPPPAGALAAAGKLLAELGAFDESGKVTGLGQRMARLGAHPRLAAMMLAAESPGETALAADLAALLEERDPLGHRAATAEIGLRLAAIAKSGATGATTDDTVDRAALARIRQAATQYRRRLRSTAAPDGSIGRLVAAAFPDRIAQRRGEPGSFRLSGGGGARLPLGDPLSKAPLLAVAALEMKAGAHIRLATPLTLAEFPQSLAARIQDTVESGLDLHAGSVLARRRRRLGALVLEDRLVPADPTSADPGETAAALAAALKIDALPWTDDALQFQVRVARMAELEPDWPDLAPAALAADRAWLVPHLFGLSRLADAATLDLLEILRAHLGHARCARLDQALPTHLPLPGGRAAVDYRQPVPLAEARAQHFYGLAATPQLAAGRVPLRLALLSPAGRPIAITGDLAAFWRGGWADARRDMRGRYPKHDWPEDPSRPSTRETSVPRRA